MGYLLPVGGEGGHLMPLREDWKMAGSCPQYWDVPGLEKAGLDEVTGSENLTSSSLDCFARWVLTLPESRN